MVHSDFITLLKHKISDILSLFASFLIALSSIMVAKVDTLYLFSLVSRSLFASHSHYIFYPARMCITPAPYLHKKVLIGH